MMCRPWARTLPVIAESMVTVPPPMVRSRPTGACRCTSWPNTTAEPPILKVGLRVTLLPKASTSLAAEPVSKVMSWPAVRKARALSPVTLIVWPAAKVWSAVPVSRWMSWPATNTSSLLVAATCTLCAAAKTMSVLAPVTSMELLSPLPADASIATAGTARASAPSTRTARTALHRRAGFNMDIPGLPREFGGL